MVSLGVPKFEGRKGLSMLRKNKDGRLERLQPDGAWTEVPEHEQPESVRHQPAVSTVGAETAVGTVGVAVDWSQLSDLFADAPALEDAQAEHADAARQALVLHSSKEDADADRGLGAGAAAGGDLAGAVHSAGAGHGALDAAAAPSGPGPAAGRGPGSDGPAGGPLEFTPEGPLDLGEIPGLTSGDGKAGTAGTRNVLAKLRARRGIAQVGDRPPAVRVEVATSAARPRGPAVRDTTEHRLVKREKARNGAVSTRVQDKPAPKSLAEAPRWMQELFESHFRSVRTLELRKSMNRMKLSRLDYAIGWMVMLEAARRDPSILHVRKDGSTVGAA